MNALNKWAKRSVWLVLAAVLAMGCNPLQVIGFLTTKDEKVPPKYPLRPKEGPKKDRDEEIKLLILIDRANNTPQEFAMVHNDLATALTKHFPEFAKTNKDTIAVVPASEVAKYKQGNPTWRTDRVVDIGRKLGADYVLDITLEHINVYQPNSRNEIYEGRAEVYVDIYDVASKSVEPKDKYIHPFAYPKTGMMLKDRTPVQQFKEEFVNRLAFEIIEKHQEHKQSSRIAQE